MSIFLEGGDDREHSYGWVAAKFGQATSDYIAQLADDIDADDVYNVEGYGIEDNPHITVLYGILDGQEAAVNDIMEGQKEFSVRLARLGLFQNDKYDVLHLEVESPELHALNNELVSGLSYKNDYPEYKPHVTIAYLRKGMGERYLYPFTFKPTTERIDKAFYESSDKSVRLDFKLEKDNSLPRKVRFKEIGAAQMWVDKLPEKYREKIVPFYFEEGGFYGVALVADTPSSMPRHKGVFNAHVEATGLRPMFCFLNRADSMHMMKDPAKAATDAGPENKTQNQAQLEITDEDLETADEELDEIPAEEMEDFEEILADL
jgi:2'-5' RNA ligase